MKTNLLLLDSLQNMENLIRSAFSVSDELKRKLKITYIFDFRWISSGQFTGATAPTMDAALLNVEKGIRKDFEKAEQRIREITTHYLERNPFHVPYEFEVAEISRLDYVNQVLEEEKDILLLMSNYNSYSATAGTISYPNVIDKVGCPVLIIPENSSAVDFKNIIYASALHEEDLVAMRHLSRLFNDAKDRNLTVFHNEEESPDFEETLKWEGFQSMVTDTINTFHYSFELSHEKKVEEGLERAVKRTNPDLIVLLKEKKGFFEDIFSSSETRNVITHIDKPVLVYHEKNLA